ncbi:hypothetical protein COW36_05785 [bacterium (Candidatus Blackallbacteria) CG17_big_fil_post_rev_8_21_14_2_50_48_46]|uniref:Peptidase C39 domain-containing protein n=1 Tax=bacterium (Candidatus Blackallbacteria) CG17_big_fil_post_rev_8_21_14_2_50_48_46 TaxID=2014261 RepID=A0A2M7G8D6_9BACT|nr:MAG: hypothetical protein COW64_21380 [bacterium (Candidatus Blackallbacteria) CG18_big_fil_WC_8_21_14_2_50_49_26]PIW18278.1 MAG: hypothetical protein COW36_05785 [bacterium (Candidatus Blackallbacteria) CG17_big_fil_post_rev_8_21_14_2_50_48_46]PIW49502.1 MAG: hypothetical protein COW20_05600 [bacterium (Candidatus Blackallbacteria) CG13_big_fil_rev_8_21_14_2_50_49_14]
MYTKIQKLLILSFTTQWLLSCSPPVVPVQQTQVTRSGNLSTSSNRLSRFNLQQSAVNFKNGKKLLVSANGNIYLSPVPFVTQGNDNTCAQAVMTMLLQYWGQEIDYQTVVNENNPLNLGTTYDKIQEYLAQKGLQAEAFREGSLEVLLNEIQKGSPVMVLLNFGALDREHYVLVVGYNAKRNTLILHESRSGPYVELEANQFMDYWNNLPVVTLPIFGGSNYFRLMFKVSGPVSTSN